MEFTEVPTRPRRAAGLVTTGLVLLLLSGLVFAVGAVDSITSGASASGPGVVMLGAAGVVVATVVLAVGVHRLVEHADRAGGVRVIGLAPVDDD